MLSSLCVEKESPAEAGRNFRTSPVVTRSAGAAVPAICHKRGGIAVGELLSEVASDSGGVERGELVFGANRIVERLGMVHLP